MAIATKSIIGAPHPASPVSQASAEHHPVDVADLVRFALVGAAAAASWTGVSPRLTGLEPVSLAAALIGGYPVFREAVDNMAARRMTMELSMTLALTAALAIKEFSTALFILFFVLGAEMLEHLTVSRGRRAIQNLLDLLPKTAWRRRGYGVEEVSTAQLCPGDIVVIGPVPKSPSTAWSCPAAPWWISPASRENPSWSINCQAPPCLPAHTITPARWMSASNGSAWTPSSAAS